MIKLIKYCLFFFALIHFSCSHDKKIKYLSFFFDGVKSEKQKTIENENKSNLKREVSKIQYENPFVHQPYGDNNCEVCHTDNNAMFSTHVEAIKCYSCHEDYSNNLYIHGPISVGACSFCHNAHTAKYNFFLKDNINTLCLNCHSENDLSDSHDIDNICTECHNPHGSDQKHLIL